MAISYNQVPADGRVPFFYAEFDSSRAGATSVGFKSLLIGQMLAVGVATENTLIKIAGVDAATRQFGRASMLEHMVRSFRRNNPLGELYCVGISDVGAGAHATVTLTVTSAPSAAGTIALYIAGRRVAVPISGAISAEATATAIVNAVNADDDLPVSARSSTAVVTLTAQHAGTASELDVRHSYHTGESLPPSTAITIAAGAPGTSDPEIADALTAVSGERFDIIGLPSYPSPAISDLVDALDERWDATQQLDGLGIMAYRGADGNVMQATNHGGTLNSAYLSVTDAGHHPNPGYEIAAAIAGAVSAAATNDPARPFQTLPLRGILAPELTNRRAHVDQESMLKSGISTSYVDDGGVLRIQR